MTFALLLSLKRHRKKDIAPLYRSLVISPVDFLSQGSDRAKQVVSSFCEWWPFGELWSYSSCVLVRSPSKQRGGNHPLVKPRREARWPDSGDAPRSSAVPVFRPNDISSDITMLWLLNVKHVKLFAARKAILMLQYSMWTLQTGFIMRHMCLAKVMIAPFFS